ncbi:MAG: peptide ABC transporter [Rhizobiales bacterium 63-7]|nr:ABC transporter permease [Hyphomicrobiales bacterium]OJU68958.1 MAG: peptide ABC transporter [Rhizobiales bacterium 63-7]
MIGLVLRRLAGLVLTLVAVSALIFAVMNILPGDAAAIMLGTSASEDTLAALRSELGLDRPVVWRYLAWIAGALHGDFGRSYTYGVPVSELIGERLSLTLPLAGIALVLSVLVSVPLGVAAAARRRGIIDGLATLFAQMSVAMPAFWVAILLIILFSVQGGWLPAGGFPGWQVGFWPALKALILPSVALALPQAGVLTRVTRGAVLDVMHEDFARTARAKGISRRVTLWRHVLPNAAGPIVTVLGLQFTFLVAGAVLIENVFSLPGLGRLAYQALAQRDIVVMQAVVLLLSGLVIVVNFLVDLLQMRLDPRLRATPA